jgi:hypothetical protein
VNQSAVYQEKKMYSTTVDSQGNKNIPASSDPSSVRSKSTRFPSTSEEVLFLVNFWGFFLFYSLVVDVLRSISIRLSCK